MVHGLLQSIVVDSARGSPDKALYLWSDAPRFEVSTAPLADKDGQAVQLPDTLHADHALFLSDQQVSICVSSSRQSCQPLASLQQLMIGHKEMHELLNHASQVVPFFSSCLLVQLL